MARLEKKMQLPAKPFRDQNGKFHVIFIFVCLVGIILAFIKAVLLLIVPLFYQSLRAVKTKVK